MRGLLLGLLLAGLCGAGQARADAENDLFDLLMAWESVSICGFPLPDATAERLDAAIADYQGELGRTDNEIAELHEQAAWQILRQKPEMCAADGSWKARYDQIVTGLGGE